MGASERPCSNLDLDGDRPDLGLSAAQILPLISLEEAPSKGMTFNLVDVLVGDEEGQARGKGERSSVSGGSPHASHQSVR